MLMHSIDNYTTLAFSFVMGLSIFLSMPLVLKRNINSKTIVLFNAIAIGILIFLLVDIYGDVAARFDSAVIFTSAAEIVFILAFAISFMFFMFPKASRDPSENPKRTSILAAFGIGLQNLTEGLVFGSAGAAGLGSIWLISLIGFTLQNITEGFPIATPLLGSAEKIKKRFITGAFLIGGVPTIIGTIIGIMYYSQMFIVFFDALASAAILYVVLVLFHMNLKKAISNDVKRVMLITYFGILIGFIVAFVVNYI
jgi:ZIP family zinc transporter